MTVTELAILHALSDGNGKVPSEELLANLKRAKQVLESNSGCSFSFFQQLEDPTNHHLHSRRMVVNRRT